MAIRKYKLTITGVTPLLMHQDSIDGSDLVKQWNKNPANKAKGVAGDDRAPGWAWINYLYYDQDAAEKDAVIAIPAENIMKCFMEGGAMIKAGKGAKTLKSNVMSGMSCSEMYFPLSVSGNTIPVAPFLKMMREDVTDFDQHTKAANDAGFFLYCKRAKIGNSKHVRVRPRFNQWSFDIELTVWDDLIDDTNLGLIAEYAGRYKGLCDWRPSSPTPGSYGMFTASVKRIA